MSEKTLKVSQELDLLIVQYYTEPSTEVNEHIERKRQELHALTENDRG